MPGLTGKEMAAELQRRFPGLTVLHLDDLAHPLGADLPPEISAIAKPFSMEELMLRVNAVLKRSMGIAPKEEGPSSYAIGALTFDPRKQMLKRKIRPKGSLRSLYRMSKVFPR